MAKDKIDELEKKKQQLQSELHELQDELDNSLDQMRDDVSNSLNPKSIIRKYPLSVVGFSALLGYLLGHKGKGKSNSEPSPSASENSTGTTGDFRGTLLTELKRLATRKAVTFASNYVEKLLEKKAEEHLSSTSDESK